jgi:hypothetical protein
MATKGLPSIDQMRTVCKNVAELFIGYDANKKAEFGQPADHSDKTKLELRLPVEEIRGHSVNVSVTMDRKTPNPAMYANINITMPVKGVYSRGYTNVVVFPVLLYTDFVRRILFPALLSDRMQLDDSYILYMAMINGIREMWLPILIVFENFTGWGHEVAVKSSGYFYTMGVVSVKVFSFNFSRYFTFELEGKKLKYWTGKDTEKSTFKVISLDELKDCISKYLNTSKYNEFTSRYEAGYTRILELIDRF